MSLEIVLVITIEVKPGMRSEQIEAYMSVRDTVLAEAGCLQYDMMAVKGNENQFVLLERWASRSALAAHDITPHMIEIDAKSPTFRAKPAQVLELASI